MTGAPTFLTTLSPDLNGQARGKRYPISALGKLQDGTAKMPLSVLSLDCLGNDLEDSPLIFDTGDQDGLLAPTERGPIPCPWFRDPSLLLPMSMSGRDGTLFAGDPRHALNAVLKQYAALNWTPVVATELEFYLLRNEAPDPLAERLAAGGDILGIRSLEARDAFLSDLYAACEAMGIAAETASSESGANQFEVTLQHGPALRLADDTWLFKLLCGALARKHGCMASFAAKPIAQDAGNGLHVHFSLLDEAGRNVFDDGTPQGSDLLRAAVAGCLQTMADATLIFAPFQNSYDRLVPGAHAPTGIAWGYENRTAAVRIPDGPNAARRLEHRVAGGDTNPYLVIAALLGGALLGLNSGAIPPEPLQGNAYAQNLAQLAPDWASAIDQFEASADMAQIFPAQLVSLFTLCKRQDKRLCRSLGDARMLALLVDRV